jgi:hypothetical protein
VAAASGVLGFVASVWGLAGKSWHTFSLCESGECVDAYASLWSVGLKKTQLDGTVISDIVLSCSDDSSQPDQLKANCGPASTMMIVAMLLFLISLCVNALLVLDKPVPVLPKPVKVTGVMYLACSVLQWIALYDTGGELTIYINGQPFTPLPGTTGIVVILGSLLTSAAGRSLIFLPGTDGLPTKAVVPGSTAPYQNL